jgi:hypothetical protein
MTYERRVPDDPRADAELWDLVAGVPVPAAAPGFRQRLQTRLAAAALAGPAPGGDAASGASLPGPRAEPRHRRRRVSLLVAAAAVAAVVAVLTFAVLPALRGTDTATAADMLASMNAAGGGVQVVRLHIVSGFVASPHTSLTPGVIDSRTPPLEWKTTTDLTLSTHGDVRASEVSALPGTSRTSGAYGYDQRRHELRVASASSSDGVIVLRPAWSTDVPAIGLSYLEYQSSANSARASLAEADPTMPVSETTYLGRPAWQATLVLDENLREIVVVDQATGLLLASDGVNHRTRGDELIYCLRVTSLDSDPTLPAGWQVVPLLKTTTPRLRWNYFQDEGTRFGSPKSVAVRSWPTLPLIPEWAPAGYRRTDVATSVKGDPRPAHENDNSWHFSNVLVRRPHGSTPGVGVLKRLALRRCDQAVRVLFRRGFDTFTVTISPRSGVRSVADVTAQGQGWRDVVLTGGYLKGIAARTWLTTDAFVYQTKGGRFSRQDSHGPTLLAYNDRWRIVITGALTRQELIGVANSFKVYGDVDRPLPAGYAD